MNFLSKPNPEYLSKKLNIYAYVIFEYVGIFDELDRENRLKFLNIGYYIFKDNQVSKYNFILFHLIRVFLCLTTFLTLLFFIGKQIIAGNELYHNYHNSKEFNLIFFIFCLGVGILIISIFVLFRNGILLKILDTAILLIKPKYLAALMTINPNDEVLLKHFENSVYHWKVEIKNEDDFNFESNSKNIYKGIIKGKYNISEITSKALDNTTIVPILNLSETADLEDIDQVEICLNNYLPKPSLSFINSKNSKILIEFLIPFFEPEDELQLKNLILKNVLPENPILFKGACNQLADIFLQIYEQNLLLPISKKEMQMWIKKNFVFIFKTKPTHFNFATLNKLISGTKFPCKNRLLTIKNENGIIYITHEKVTINKQNKKNG